MIKAQEEILDVCSRLHAAAQDGELAGDKLARIEVIQQAATAQQLLVPVVGNFSAGKSTMINTLLGESVLPVAITPETALAAEIRYTDGEPYAEGILPDGSSKRYEISEIKKLTEDAAQFRSARVFLKNQRLKELEPLVIVDMPGFDAPNEQHNKAIVEYLDKGVFYIVLSKITDGTITRPLLNRLSEIESQGRAFALFLSNADLVQKDKAEAVRTECEDLLYSEFGEQFSVGTIDNTSVESVRQCLSSIDQNKLLKSLYFAPVNDVCSSVLEGLNLQINSARRSGEEIQGAADEIRRSIEKIKATSASDIQHMKAKYSGRMVNDIINDVGQSLENSTDEIVSAVMSKSNVEHLMNEIVRSALVQSMQQRVGEANDSIVSDFSDSVKTLSETFRNMDIDTNYSEKLVGTLQDTFRTLASSLPEFAPKALNTGLGATLGSGLGVGLSTALKAPVASALSGVAGVMATAINPILGIVIAVLPTVLGGLLGLAGQKAANSNIEQQIRSKLQGEVFPAVKSKLRSELPAILQEQLAAMIAQVQGQYESALQSQEAELQKAMQDRAASMEQAAQKKQKLEELRSSVQKIAQEIYSWRAA